VLLNALDMHAKGYETLVILEGEATKLIPELKHGTGPLQKLYDESLHKGLIAGVCRACAAKMQTLQEAENQGLPILSDMTGHPSMSGFIDRGFEIVTF
jgi:hypothetical protein